MPPPYPRLIRLLQQHPKEQCPSEFGYLSDGEYTLVVSQAWKLHFGPVRRSIARRLNDSERAAELAQSLFNDLWIQRVCFEPEYIFAAAKYSAITELRKRNRESRAMQDFARGVKPGSTKPEKKEPRPKRILDEATLRQEREKAVSCAVQRLPEYFRTPIVLLAEGKDYRQIVELTNTNDCVVTSRVYRAKKLLRRRLRDYL